MPFSGLSSASFPRTYKELPCCWHLFILFIYWQPSLTFYWYEMAWHWPQAFQCAAKLSKKRQFGGGQRSSECTRKEFPPFVVNVICQFKDLSCDTRIPSLAPYFVYHVTGMHKDPDPTCKMFTWRCRSDKCAKCADVRPATSSQILEPRSRVECS